MILKSLAFTCENTYSVNVSKMYKKCLFLILAVFVFGVKSECDGYFECFNIFFNNFFTKNNDDVEYLNITSKDLPNDFVQVNNVQISEVNKVLSEISSFIQQDVNDQLKIESDDAVFANVNPKTKVYVKTFTYNNPEQTFLSNFENFNFNFDTVNDDQETFTEDTVDIENQSLVFTPKPLLPMKEEETNIIEKDIRDNEIPLSDDVFSYYDSVEDNSTDYPVIDYVEMYKDTTNEENIYNPTENPSNSTLEDRIQDTVIDYIDNLDNSTADNTTDVTSVFPWISTIFIKNDTKSNQFEYYCDGALLSERVLITAARCVIQGNTTVDPDNLLVILGKRSLQAMADKEKTVKIKQIITHENFTNEEGKIENDLALLVFENSVIFNELIQAAIIGNNTEEVDQSFTTAWNLQGDLVPVALQDNESQACKSKIGGEHMFCASFGLNVALCPSYGGIFAGFQTEWRLYGIRSGDTTDRGLCLHKHVWFTDLRAYEDWILEQMD